MSQPSVLPLSMEELSPQDHLELVVNRVMDELVLEPVLNDTRGMDMQLSFADDAVSYNLQLRGGIGYRDSILFLRPP
jgi:hypothetical protein